ncbi:MAG: DUF5330 domain-containing protein [Pseudolabrys sp.]
MFFLLRLTFWLGLVCLLLPTGGAKTDPDSQINATQAVTLASAAVSDMRGFCDRQPAACKVGGKVAAALGQRAEHGARTIFHFVASKMGKQSDTVESTGSVGKTAARKPAARKPAKIVTVSTVDHGTLKPSDLKPPFHVRVPLPPQRAVPPGRPAV